MCLTALIPILALAHNINIRQSKITTATTSTHHPGHANLNVSNIDNDYSIIRQGGLYIEHNWIDSEQIKGLQRDIAHLRTIPFEDSDACGGFGFQPSGLSNRVLDDKNMFGPSDRLTCTITPSLGGDRKLRAAVEDKLEGLKLDLQDALGWGVGPGLELELELAELYYSVSPTPSRLPRHMDERHEDTKGEKGWLNETRRSISWLLYLNDQDWGSAESGTSGGELRAYCRKCRTQCGSHEGNVQVGWLPLEKKDTDSNNNNRNNKGSAIEIDWENGDEFEPIFLDGWVKTSVDDIHLEAKKAQDYKVDEDPSCPSLQWHPLSALYRIVDVNVNVDVDVDVDETDGDSQTEQQQHQHQQREYLSGTFGPNSPTWPSDTNLDPAEFSNALASQLPASIRNKFISTEAIHERPIDVPPTGGSLVLFDSVAVPHEVLPTTKGERLAIAGWFHEIQQPCPDWYGT